MDYYTDASENDDFLTDFAIFTKALRTDRRINGPMDQRTNGPMDQRTNGPRDGHTLL